MQKATKRPPAAPPTSKKDASPSRKKKRIKFDEDIEKERKKRFEMRIRKKRRVLSKSSDSLQKAMILMASEVKILSMPNGFNEHPMEFLRKIMRIKYHGNIQTYQAVKKLEILKENKTPTPKIVAQAAEVYKCIVDDDVVSFVRFLNDGFDVNYHNKFGETVLHYACKQQAIACIHELIERGVKVGVCCVSGRTPLHVALWYHREVSLDLVRLLCSSEPTLLLAADYLDCTPLDAVTPTQWPVMCDFLNLSVDHYYEDLKYYLKKADTHSVAKLENEFTWRPGHHWRGISPMVAFSALTGAGPRPGARSHRSPRFVMTSSRASV